MEIIITFFLKGFCLFVLFIYVVGIFRSFIKHSNKNSGIMATLTVFYCIFAVRYIFENILKLEVFGKQSSKILETEGIFIKFAALFIGLIVITTFLSNFAKAFYTLHGLDYGDYPYCENWQQIIKDSIPIKKYTEFFLRGVTAYFFLQIEHSLIDSSKVKETYIIAISNVARDGLLLYSFLLAWWAFNAFALKIGENYYKLTDKSFSKIKHEFNLSEALENKLRVLKYKKYKNKDAFLNDLSIQVGNEGNEKLKTLIINNAKLQGFWDWVKSRQSFIAFAGLINSGYILYITKGTINPFTKGPSSPPEYNKGLIVFFLLLVLCFSVYLLYIIGEHLYFYVLKDLLKRVKSFFSCKDLLLKCKWKSK